MSWFNANAPAIQAIATLASVLMAVVLALITARYVRLTSEILATARLELDFMKAERSAAFEERRRRLLSLIFHLRMIATVFSSEHGRAEQIRHVPLWSESDPDDLRILAVSFGSAAAELAGEAARHLATIRELAMQVQRTPTAVGVDWNRFAWDRWSSAIQGAERCLQSVANIVERTDPFRPENNLIVPHRPAVSRTPRIAAKVGAVSERFVPRLHVRWE